MTQLAAAVLQLLADNDGSAAVIADALGVSIEVVAQALVELEHDGLVESAMLQ